MQRNDPKCNENPFPTPTESRANVDVTGNCPSTRIDTLLRCTTESAIDLGFYFSRYTCDLARCTSVFRLLTRLFSISGTPGTPFQRKPSHMRARARRERCTNGDAKLFPGTDVREASEVRPIPDMGEKTRLQDAAQKIPMRHQSSGRHALWLTKSTAASQTPRPTTHAAAREANGNHRPSS